MTSKWIAIKKSDADVKLYLTEERKQAFEKHPSFIKSTGKGGTHLYKFVLNPDYKAEKAPAPKEAKLKDVTN